MKTRDEFVAEREPRWARLEALLDRPDSASDGESLRQAAALHRALCADVMQVRSLGYGHDLRWRLDALAARANTFLYRTPRREGTERLRELLAEFPREVRRRGVFLLVASVLFWLPFGVGLLGASLNPEFSERVLPASTLEQMSSAYSKGFSEGRASGEDAAMAGFYVQNNIGIAFRCFAGGVFLGVGSLFFLAYNGAAIGAVAGYLTMRGYTENFYSFVVTHGAFELTAIVVSGAAGLAIGHALVAPKRLGRVQALKKAAAAAVPLIYCATTMLLIAAALEAFWSSSRWVAPSVKYTVGGCCWLLVLFYLGWQGRPRAADAFAPDTTQVPHAA